MDDKKITSEKGMMVVEASISFTIFIIVIVCIIYLINIFTLHNKIQFAINSAAHQLASYSYLYEAVGLRSGDKTVGADGEPYAQPIDDTVTQVVDSLNKIQQVSSDFEKLSSVTENEELSPSSVENMYNQLQQTGNDVNEAVDSVKKSAVDLRNLLSDADALVAGVIYMGASKLTYEAKHAFGSAAAWVLTKNYLQNDLSSQNADEYLKSYGISEGYNGLDFSGSSIFCDEKYKIVDIVVEYDIDFSFAKLIIPEAKLHVVQRVSVAGWLNGDEQEVPDKE